MAMVKSQCWEWDCNDHVPGLNGPIPHRTEINLATWYRGAGCVPVQLFVRVKFCILTLTPMDCFVLDLQLIVDG